jgi:hypothetical protein
VDQPLDLNLSISLVMSHLIATKQTTAARFILVSMAKHQLPEIKPLLFTIGPQQRHLVTITQRKMAAQFILRAPLMETPEGNSLNFTVPPFLMVTIQMMKQAVRSLFIPLAQVTPPEIKESISTKMLHSKTTMPVMKAGQLDF